MFSCSLLLSFPEKSKLESSCARSHRLPLLPAVLHGAAQPLFHGAVLRLGRVISWCSVSVLHPSGLQDLISFMLVTAYRERYMGLLLG